MTETNQRVARKTFFFVKIKVRVVYVYGDVLVDYNVDEKSLLRGGTIFVCANIYLNRYLNLCI